MTVNSMLLDSGLNKTFEDIIFGSRKCWFKFFFNFITKIQGAAVAQRVEQVD